VCSSDLQRLGTNTGKTIGNGSDSYGIIGARSTATAFDQAPAGNFFTGQIAEMAMWEGGSVDSATVITMMREGIAAAGPSSHWVLNDIPSAISADAGVFTDYGNLGSGVDATDQWGRHYGPTLAIGDNPLLYSWDVDRFPNTELKNLPVGSYSLTVRNNLGCTDAVNDRQTYTISNSDAQSPEILFNVALRRTTVSQISNGSNGCGATAASFAVDGNLDNFYNNCSVAGTGVADEPWWNVNLGLNYNVRRVIVYHDSEASERPTNIYVLISQSPINSLADTTMTAAVQFRKFAGTPPDVQEFVFNNVARYVRIFDKNNGVDLRLAEVEVYGTVPSPHTRTFYLGSDDCYYTITEGDGSVNPIAVDNCGAIVSFTHDVAGLGSNESLLGFDVPVGSVVPVIWTAIDDAGSSSTFTVNYRVLDTIRPVITNPHAGLLAYDTLTWCDVNAGYSLNLPMATDNYKLPGRRCS
jgi:hypothetical protein